MSKKSWLFAACALLLGLVVGAGGNEMIHRVSKAHSKEVFAEKIKCNALAKRYIESQSSSSIFMSNVLALNAVDYSPSRNSCIALLDQSMMTPSRPDLPIHTIQVVDIGTEEVLKSLPCPKDGACLDYRNQAHTEFEKAVKK